MKGGGEPPLASPLERTCAKGDEPLPSTSYTNMKGGTDFMKESAGFIMHADDADMYNGLTPEEFYNVVYGAFRYYITGDSPVNLTRYEKLIFNQLAKRIDSDKAHYEKLRSARSVAGKKGAQIRYQKSPEFEAEDDDDYMDLYRNWHPADGE